ncbi:GtrA family protein [Pseudooceanicola sp. LIPI14-2-Ac024]|uniref:GtrA family protein n=1 Tax=Pseudooceanicola sp. LIPI14-2-Ac024 TaxID=3344875 RepID=UPI0035D115E7
MKRRLGQLLRYAGTAGVAAVVDLGGFILLEGAGLNVALAAALSFMIATVVNYLLTARFVFGHPASLQGYGAFLAAAGVGFAINVGVTMLAYAALDAEPAMAKAIGIATAFFANFVLNATFVFRDPK